MKKVLSIALALIMALALSTVAFATNEDVTFNIPVYYVATNAGTTKPANTFTVTIGANTTANAPTFKSNVATLAFAESSNAEDVAFAEFTVKADSFKCVGTYTYDMTIAAAEDLAGVTTDSTTAKLTVYVTQGDTSSDFVAYYNVKYNGTKVAGGVWNTTENKYEKGPQTTAANGTFTNVYKAAGPDEDTGAKGLAVTKTVTGNFGDKTKDFNVKVTFTSDKKVGAGITYTDDSSAKTLQLTLNEGKYTGSATITLKHGETVAFGNVPYGVTYTVVEDSYEGYDAPAYTNESGTVASPSIAVGITNNCQGSIDTGVILDFAPYIIIMAFVATGVVLMMMKKRKVEEI